MDHRTFADLGVSEAVSRAMDREGITTPFPIQSLVIPDAVAGRNVLARSRTGSGKTIAFAVPIVERLAPGGRRPSALVLVPTRELASQVLADLRPLAEAKGLRAAAAYGGISIREQAKALERADVVVATPGRLEDLADRRTLKLDAVRILVLDEADRMLDMGFLPQVDAIVRRLPSERQTLFLSATLDGEVGRMAARWAPGAVLHETVDVHVLVDEADHRFVQVTQHGKVDALAALIAQEPGLCLVFVRTKRGADRLAHRLKAKGIPAAAMHGDMPQSSRERALKRFTSGAVPTLVATDVAARGLDVEGIAHVVNYDPPEDDKGYVHRVGRTARAGRTGTGITLVLPDQQADVSRIAARLQLQDEFTREGMKVAPPRLVYQSKTGRRSLLHGHPGRRRGR
ncbi:MAG: DEAD/DEAH box helicase [Actinobacteria bacterium]|nr:DEAD/DEAH box helicase [Actinomycetota bacterium]